MNLKSLKYIVFAVVVLLLVSGTSSAIVESTWGYEYDVVGNTPLDALTVTEGADTTIRVSSNTSHIGNNSLYIYDDNTALGKATYELSTSTNSTKITKGSITYFVNFSNTNENYFLTYNTPKTLIGISLKFVGGTTYYFNGTSYIALGSYVTNKTNNITIVFNSTNQSFDYYLNNTYIKSGVYRQAAENVNVLHFETLGSDTAKFYIDDIKVIDSDTPTLPEIRKFPYPYVSAWTLSSDIDDTDWREFYDIYDFLNTEKNISGLGNGTNLDISSNFWMQAGNAFGGGNIAGCYYQTAFITTPLCTNSSITLDYLRSGHLDTAHNWASSVFNMSVAGNFVWYIDMLSVLNGNGINITSWVNHGGTSIITNIGTSNAAWAGDNNTNASAYHLNRTMANQSLHYYWESEGVSTLTGNYINYPLENKIMDDSSKLYMFYRVKSGFLGTPYNRNLSTQINYSTTQQAIRRSGYAITYTHLGYNGTSIGDVMNPVFDAATIQELRNISDYYHGTNGKSKQIYVTTLAKMLRYAEVSEYLNYTYNSTLGTIVIHSVNNSVRNFTPTVADLEGITFLVPTTTNIFIGETNVTSSTTANAADETGNVSIMFPISRLSYPYPEISSVGSYNISSTGVVLWNRNTTRPTISQKINVTIVVSSGTVNFTSSIWNTTGDYRKVFNLSASASVTAGDFAPNTNNWVYKNGVKWTILKSNSTGYISFSDTITSETQYSTTSTTVQDAYKTSTCQSTLQWGVVGSALIIVLILLTAGGLALGFMSGTLKIDTFPIQEFVLSLVAVVVIGSLGVAIINPIIIVVGCP